MEKHDTSFLFFFFVFFSCFPYKYTANLFPSITLYWQRYALSRRKQTSSFRQRDHGEYWRDSGGNREVGFSFTGLSLTTFNRNNIHASSLKPYLICLQVCCWICRVLLWCLGFCSHQKTFFLQFWRSMVRMIDPRPFFSCHFTF